MLLREFVCQALVDLVRGIEDAQDELSTSKAIINPLGTPDIIKLHKGEDTSFTSVEFEIQVDVKKSKKADGGAKLAVMDVFSTGAGRQNESSRGETNKIKFSVPIHFPPGKLFE
jgi:hypothetical protein